MKKANLEKMKSKLSPEAYNVCFLKGTEMPFSGKYTGNYEPGIYYCVVCDTPLFSSEAKFDSKTGWPSFDKPVQNTNIAYEDDYDLGIKRIEVKCKTCGAHLGHLFSDGPTQSGKRFCINSLALDFVPQGKI